MWFDHSSVINGCHSDRHKDVAFFAGFILTMQNNIKAIPYQNLVPLVKLKMDVLQESKQSVSIHWLQKQPQGKVKEKN